MKEKAKQECVYYKRKAGDRGNALVPLANLWRHKKGLIIEYRTPYLRQFGLKVCSPEYYNRVWRPWIMPPTKEESESMPWASLATICEICKRGCGGCSWSDRLVPVRGWAARKTYIKRGPIDGFWSYRVMECPRFLPGRSMGRDPAALQDDGCIALIKAMLDRATDDYCCDMTIGRRVIERWVREAPWFEDPDAIIDRLRGIARTVDKMPKLKKAIGRRDEMYTGVAYLADGRELHKAGTMQECAYWADGISKRNAGCRIDIQRVEKPKKTDMEVAADECEAIT